MSQATIAKCQRLKNLSRGFRDSCYVTYTTLYFYYEISQIYI